MVKDLDPALQQEAVKILSPYATGRGVSGSTALGADGGEGGSTHSENGAPADITDLRSRLLEAHGEEKPADNALMCAAVWFAEYGKEPFSLDQLRAIANEMGVTLPDRLDMTISAGKRKGKKLFNRARTGYYAPTVHGETFLKTTYGVKQGTKKPPGAE